MTAPSTKVPPVRNNPSKIQLDRISHSYFEHPDLDRFSEFAKDFGFVEAARHGNKIYYRGYGKDPYIYVASRSTDGVAHFRGTAFVAASQDDFDKAAKLPGAVTNSLDTAPGGGKIITFTRPDDVYFHIVHGQTDRKVTESEATLATHEYMGPANLPFEKRRFGQFQRFRQGPAMIHKLGHFGYVCRQFDEEVKWLTSNFNFVPSDVLHLEEDKDMDVMIFMHLDLGDDWSDHHSFFMQRAPPNVEKTYLHHTSYEIADFDTQLLGHSWLAKKGWKNVWGVGRHILGSQLFDYWFDSTGFMVEHYADGDLVNSSHETKHDTAGPVSIWGPDMPKDFGRDGTIDDLLEHS